MTGIARTIGPVGVVVLTVALLLLAILNFFLVRYLDRSLHQAVSAAEDLAQADVTTRIVVESEDEFGALLTSMQRMTIFLREMALAADTMAAGDFTVEVAPRSDRDVFGSAFQTMSSRLERMIGRMASASDRLPSSVGPTPSPAGTEWDGSTSSRTASLG